MATRSVGEHSHFDPGVRIWTNLGDELFSRERLRSSPVVSILTNYSAEDLTVIYPGSVQLSREKRGKQIKLVECSVRYPTPHHDLPLPQDQSHVVDCAAVMQSKRTSSNESNSNIAQVCAPFSVSAVQ